jgi:hypothetical protein
MVSSVVVLLHCVFFAVVSGYVGSKKGRTGLGIVLGFFLSVAGLVIIAVIKPKNA